MIKITRLASGTSATARLRVDGRIVGKTVDELEDACLAALEEDEPFVLDLAGVSFVDAAAARMIDTLVARGTVVVGCSTLITELLRAGTERGDERPARDDEAALVAGLRRNDPRAFEDLVQLYGGRMLAVARRMLRVEEDARDAVQEAFVSAFKALDGFQGNARSPPGCIASS